MKKFTVSLVVALVCALSGIPSAEAGFRMRIEDTTSGQGVVLTDNATGDINSTLGAIVFSGAIGQFAVTVTTGTSKPLIGGSNNYAEMDLNNVTINTVGAGTLRIILEDTGFDGGPMGQQLFRSGVGGVLTATSGSNINIQSYVDATNAFIDLGPDVSTPGALGAIGTIPGTHETGFGASGVTFGNGAFSTQQDVNFNRTGPLYSMGAVVTINFTGAGSVSFNENLQTLPEPTSVVAWSLFALLGIVASRRLRKR